MCMKQNKPTFADSATGILQLPSEEPFVVGMNVSVPSPEFQLQKLEHFTLVFVNQGTAQVEIDFRLFRIKQGDMLVLATAQFFQCIEAAPDLNLSYVTLTRDIYHEVTLAFDVPFFAFLKEYPCLSAPDKNHVWQFNHLLHLLTGIYQDRKHTFRLPIFKNILQCFLMDLYNKVREQFLCHDTVHTSQQEELLGKFITLVFQHSGTRREVQFYADSLSITTRYLSSVVKSLTGITPKGIIDSRCIQEIKMQLRTTRDSMQEIAFRLDFPDQSFFNRYFKKHTGITPVDYRKSRGSMLVAF